jgi:hypothetical protein
MKLYRNLMTLTLILMMTLLFTACNTSTNDEEKNSNAVPSTANSGASTTGTPAVANHGGSTTSNAASSSHSQSTVEDNANNGSVNHTNVNDNSGTSTGTSTNSNNTNNTSVGSNSEDTTDSTGTSNNNNATSNNNYTTGNDQNHTGSTESNATTEANTTTIALKTLMLTVNKSTLNKDTNTTLKVEALYKNNTKEDVTTKVEWIEDKQGIVSIYDHTLIAKEDKDITLQAKLDNKTSNSITLHIYWKVNGHTLPPEPDPKVNNATLLGVDVNNNGVRDDVERWIYETYSYPIERGIMLQNANRLQTQISDISKAHEYAKLSDKSLSCEYYLLVPTPSSVGMHIGIGVW